MNTMLSGALELISGPLNNILDQLAGEKNELWLQILQLMSRMSPEKILSALKASVLKLWKKLSVGGNTKGELLEKFKTAIYKVAGGEKTGIQASEWARDIASKSECAFPADMEEDVEFVMGSLGDLFGFKKNAETQVFLDETFLAKYDLEPCKPSDAFYLRLAYLEQPLDEWVRVGMKLIIDSDRHPLVFRLGHRSDGLWLRAHYAYPGNQWNPGLLWIFRRKIAKP